MDNVTNFLERSKEFEQAHYSCKELLEEQLGRIERFAGRWLPLAIVLLFVFNLLGFIYFHLELVKIRKKIDHRYFLIIESLEDIHHVKTDQGKVVREYTIQKAQPKKN